MIYKKKAFEVCRQGLNVASWNNWVLLIGSRAITCWDGHFKIYRVAA